jgi:hypothetical protein
MSESSEEKQNYWKLCNLCKKPIPFGAVYYLCSVSTCRTQKLTLHFCSYACWDGHLAFARHKSAECEESKAPER